MSDWKEGAAKRRDARHTKSPDVAPKPSAANRKKNTKKWCRGKVGVEHKPECRDYNEAKLAARDYNGRPVNLYAGWKILICTVCGKELDHYYPFRGTKREPPTWVT